MQNKGYNLLIIEVISVTFAAFLLVEMIPWLGSIPCGSAGKESACNVGDLGSIPGLGRSPREGKDYPIQYSGLENYMNCKIHQVTKSRTQLSYFHFHFYGPYAFPLYTAQAPGRSAGVLFKASPAFLALPMCKLLRFSFSSTWQGHRLSWVCVFCPSLV